MNIVFLFQEQAEKDYGFEETNDQNSPVSSASESEKLSEKMNSRPVRSLGVSTLTKNKNSNAIRPISSQIGNNEQKGNSQEYKHPFI